MTIDQNKIDIATLRGEMNTVKAETEGAIKAQAIHAESMKESASRVETCLNTFMNKTSESIKHIHTRIDANGETTIANARDIKAHLGEEGRNSNRFWKLVGIFLGLPALLATLIILIAMVDRG